MEKTIDSSKNLLLGCNAFRVQGFSVSRVILSFAWYRSLTSVIGKIYINIKAISLFTSFLLGKYLTNYMTCSISLLSLCSLGMSYHVTKLTIVFHHRAAHAETYQK